MRRVQWLHVHPNRIMFSVAIHTSKPKYVSLNERKCRTCINYLEGEFHISLECPTENVTEIRNVVFYLYMYYESLCNKKTPLF